MEEGSTKARFLTAELNEVWFLGMARSLEMKRSLSSFFEPGFSTADTITDVSGRGVGMDVVKRNIENLKGRVEISSQPGVGTTTILRIPLTLAIIQGMIVRVSDERYILPLLSIRETFRPTRDMLSTVTGKGELISIRGEILPLYRLDKIFEIQGALQDPTDGIVLIVEDGRERVALLADDLLGQQQTVIKSLSESFGFLKGISGACILSDGRVGLILDIKGILELATCEEQTEEMASPVPVG